MRVELTVSEILSYLSCPHRYWLDQLEERTPQTPAQAIGSAIAAAQYWRVHHGERDPKALTDVALVHWLRTSNENGYSEGSWIKGRKAIPGAVAAMLRSIPERECRAEVSMACVVTHPQYPDIVIAVRGRADLVGAGWIADLKVGREIRDNSYVRQLALYAMMSDDKMLSRGVVHNVYKTGEKYRHRAIEHLLTQGVMDAARSIAYNVGRAVIAGIDTPCSELAWWCSRMWCARWEGCAVRK